MSVTHDSSWFALTALLLLACSSDDRPGDDGASETADARVLGATVDAGADAGSTDTGADAASADAASPTGQVDPCGRGKVSCDDSCIDEIAPTGSAIVERVFAKSCGFASSCHGGSAPKEGLALDTVDRLFSTAVSKRSTQSSTRKLVEPGSPDDSYLLDKLLGRDLQVDPGTGQTSDIMPQPPSDPLCAAKTAAVRAWIQAGATR